MKKYRMRLCSLLIGIFLICGFSIVLYKGLSVPVPIMKVATENVKEIEPYKLVYFEDFGETDFTCTGLTYDEHNQTFWIVDYGALNGVENTLPRIIEIDKNFQKTRKTISLVGIVEPDSNVQGLAYDSSNDSFWIATAKYVYNIDKIGNVLISWNLYDFSKYSANGVCYDKDTNTIWVLCYSKYLLNIDKHGKVLKKMKVNFRDQDHLWIANGIIYVTVGADYNGEDNYIITIDTDTENIDVLYKVNGSYAIEGLCIVDDKLYIANDGLFHNAKIKHSYISVYEVD